MDNDLDRLGGRMAASHGNGEEPGRCYCCSLVGAGTMAVGGGSAAYQPRPGDWYWWWPS